MQKETQQSQSNRWAYDKVELELDELEMDEVALMELTEEDESFFQTDEEMQADGEDFIEAMRFRFSAEGTITVHLV